MNGVHGEQRCVKYFLFWIVMNVDCMYAAFFQMKSSEPVHLSITVNNEHNAIKLLAVDIKALGKIEINYRLPRIYEQALESIFE